ncbi:T7SS effector LXG polymorphic toxin [Streptococcus suis]|nr:T7SS effector LXG polymorphic toxin [Streptococcus suis]
MVKMNLPSSDNQATSFGRVSASRMGAYESAMQALVSFIDATGLSGQAYKNAKDYAASTLLPLLKAAILYEESLSEAVKRLPSDYRATEYLEGKSLDSEDLEAELARLESVGMRLERSIDRALEMARDYPDYEWHAHSMMRQLHQVIDRKNKVRRQLQALLAFNERSSSFFSGIGDLETDLSQGIAQVGSDMSNFSGSFPNGLSPVWVSKVNQKWNDRVKRMRDTSSPADFRKLEEREAAQTEAFNTVVNKLNSGEQLSEADFNTILAYASTHRETELPDNVVKLILATTLSASGVEDSDLEASLLEVWNQMKENVSVGSITYDVITSSLEEIADNPSTSLNAIYAVSGNLSKSIDDLALQANNYLSVRTPYGNIQYASSMVDDLALSGTQTVTNNAIRAGSVVNFLSRNAGLIKALTIVYDYESQVSEGTSQTNAAIKTAAHVGISYAAGEVGAIAGAKIGAAIGTVVFPGVGTVSGAAVGAFAGFVIGVGISYVGSLAFDAIYDTYIGEQVDNAVDKAKGIVEDVGDAVSRWFSNLGSAIG